MISTTTCVWRSKETSLVMGFPRLPSWLMVLTMVVLGSVVPVIRLTAAATSTTKAIARPISSERIHLSENRMHQRRVQETGNANDQIPSQSLLETETKDCIAILNRHDYDRNEYLDSDEGYNFVFDVAAYVESDRYDRLCISALSDAFDKLYVERTNVTGLFASLACKCRTHEPNSIGRDKFANASHSKSNGTSSTPGSMAAYEEADHFGDDEDCCDPQHALNTRNVIHVVSSPNDRYYNTRYGEDVCTTLIVQIRTICSDDSKQQVAFQLQQLKQQQQQMNEEEEVSNIFQNGSNLKKDDDDSNTSTVTVWVVFTCVLIVVVGVVALYMKQENKFRNILEQHLKSNLQSSDTSKNDNDDQVFLSKEQQKIASLTVLSPNSNHTGITYGMDNSIRKKDGTFKTNDTYYHRDKIGISTTAKLQSAGMSAIKWVRMKKRTFVQMMKKQQRRRHCAAYNGYSDNDNNNNDDHDDYTNGLDKSQMPYFYDIDLTKSPVYSHSVTTTSSTLHVSPTSSSGSNDFSSPPMFPNLSSCFYLADGTKIECVGNAEIEEFVKNHGGIINSNSSSISGSPVKKEDQDKDIPYTNYPHNSHHNTSKYKRSSSQNFQYPINFIVDDDEDKNNTSHSFHDDDDDDDEFINAVVYLTNSSMEDDNFSEMEVVVDPSSSSSNCHTRTKLSSSLATSPIHHPSRRHTVSSSGGGGGGGIPTTTTLLSPSSSWNNSIKMNSSSVKRPPITKYYQNSFGRSQSCIETTTTTDLVVELSTIRNWKEDLPSNNNPTNNIHPNNINNNQHPSWNRSLSLLDRNVVQDRISIHDSYNTDLNENTSISKPGEVFFI